LNTILLLIIIIVVGSVIIVRTNSIRTTLKNDTPKALQQVIDAAHLHELAQIIYYYDEVLTQSARNYALTGELKWKTRYNEAVPKLGTVIQEAITKGNTDDHQRFLKVEQANNALVDMELRSQVLADQGDLAGARSILESTDYAVQKAIYQSALVTHVAQRSAQADQAVQDSAGLLQRAISNVENLSAGNRRLVEYFMSAIIGLAIILALVIFRSILIPIGKVNKAAKKIASGKMQQKIGPISNDEVGQLAQSFNTMSDSLQQSYQQLENKVIARTQDLAKYKLAVQNSNEHIVITDPDGQILYGNHAAELITGFTLKEMLGQTPRLWGRQMGPDFYKSFWHQIKEQKKPFFGEFTNKRKSGEQYTAEAAVTPVLDDHGQVLFFVGIERDITKQKKYVETLNRLAAIVDSSDDAIIGKTLEGVITSWNNGATRLYGYTAQEIIGRSVNIIVPDDHLHEIQKILKKIGEGKIIEHYQTIRRKKDKTLVDVSITVSPIRDHSGRVIGASTIARDIAKEKQIERMKSDFVSLVSHQLKTPVAIIRGDVENLLAGLFGPVNKKQREYLEDIRITSIRNYNLIADLLNVSRIERGVIEVDPQPIKMTEVLDEALHDYRPAMADRKLKLEVEPYNQNLLVMADREKFVQCLANVVNNALKFTTKGGITIRVKPDNKIVKIQIKDTGRGIDEATIAKLFSRDLVMSVDPSPDKSSGLGLYIAKNFMKLQHGDVTVSSRVGQGSQFDFSIPIADT